VISFHLTTAWPGALTLVGLLIFGLFTMGAALAPDAGSWLVCRFFAGLFGCPPLTNFGGTTADLWSPAERTYVFPVLLCLCFLGPFLAPMVASFIGASSLVSWQWTGMYMTLNSGSTRTPN
jgi:MFS family permease